MRRAWLAVVICAISGCRHHRSDSDELAADAGACGEGRGDGDDDDLWWEDRDAGAQCGGPSTIAPGQRVDGDLDGTCGTTDPGCSTSIDQPDRMYAVEHGAGLLTVELDSTFDAVLELRGKPDEPAPGTCADVAFAEASEVVSACVQPGTTWALVDGHGDGDVPPATRAFSIVATMEACDEGETCRPELGACASDLDPGDTCDGAVPLGPDATVLAHLAALANDLTLTCAALDGPDGVFSIDVPMPGELSFEVWDPAFRDLPVAALRQGCGEAADEIACGEFGSGHTCLDAGAYQLAIEGDGDLAVQTRFRSCEADETCQRGFCLPPLIDEPEPNEDPDVAPEVAAGSWIAASFDPSTDVDWYRVRVPADSTLTASTVAGCDADTVVMLLAGDSGEWPSPDSTDCSAVPEGSMLDCSDDADRSLCGRAEASVYDSGDVLVRVSRHSLERDEPAPGPYVLHLTVE